MTNKISDKYTVDFDKLSSDSEILNNIRNDGMNRFINIGLPTARKGNEKWKYTNIAPIAGIDFELPVHKDQNDLDDIKKQIFSDNSWVNLIFLDGKFNSELSDALDLESISISDLDSLIHDPSMAIDLENDLGSLIDLKEEGFAALNTAFLSDGIVIHVPEGVKFSKLINIVFFNSGEKNTVSYPRVLLKVGSSSDVSIMESYVGGSQNISFTNSVSEIILDKRARVKHYRILDESDTTYDVGYGRVKLDEDSQFLSRSFYKGAAIGRYDLNVSIEGERGFCDLKGLYLTTGSQHMDNFINIDHVAPSGKSNLLYKGILDDNSRAVFGGTVMVRQSAQKTDSIQSDKNLLLSTNAEVDSKPSLFIYADDVKCAHGATAGNIDSETIFYMLSRGIDIETASKLLIYGFAGEIIDSVEIEELRDKLEAYFLNALPDYKFEF
ncbi:MAG: Fe-S cluster assembly protein SufD [Chloroflexi bacterium]|nr:Fe-S cluster assembly protein SufD [Chloroflexota bacterium]